MNNHDPIQPGPGEVCAAPTPVSSGDLITATAAAITVLAKAKASTDLLRDAEIFITPEILRLLADGLQQLRRCELDGSLVARKEHDAIPADWILSSDSLQRLYFDMIGQCHVFRLGSSVDCRRHQLVTIVAAYKAFHDLLAAFPWDTVWPEQVTSVTDACLAAGRAIDPAWDPSASGAAAQPTSAGPSLPPSGSSTALSRFWALQRIIERIRLTDREERELEPQRYRPARLLVVGEVQRGDQRCLVSAHLGGTKKGLIFVLSGVDRRTGCPSYYRWAYGHSACENGCCSGVRSVVACGNDYRCRWPLDDALPNISLKKLLTESLGDSDDTRAMLLAAIRLIQARGGIGRWRELARAG